MDEPYQLFMQPLTSEKTVKPITRNMDWNFTLGDCQNEVNEPKINDLSLIEELHHVQTVELS